MFQRLPTAARGPFAALLIASAILGFVGAGGLGQQLELSMRMFQFDEVLTLLAILFALVATVDFISGRIRGWIA